jgi:hypothetical protein
MSNPEDQPEDETLAALNEQTLRLLGKRLFAEAREQGASEDAAFDARVRERSREQQADSGSVSGVADTGGSWSDGGSGGDGGSSD